MKNMFKTILFVMVSGSFCVPALIAAPENHEEFAKNYMPETQAVFERFREECAATEVLRTKLANNLEIMNRKLDDDASYCALTAKIKALETQEAEWVKLIKDCYFKNKGKLLSIDQLSEINLKTVKEKIEWEKDILKPFLQNFVKNFAVPVLVKIPNRNYYIGKYEVTQLEYKYLMRENPSKYKDNDLPVTNISWFDAIKFCEKLTLRERYKGRLPKGYKYTLPTSEQWEYSCRAGTTTRFCSGDSKEDLSRVAWWAGNSDYKTHPVGTKEPNAWGIYDMHGNVWEWCLDEHPEYQLGRVGRGGGKSSNEEECSSSSIDSFNSIFGDKNYLGFRVALVPAGR